MKNRKIKAEQDDSEVFEIEEDCKKKVGNQDLKKDGDTKQSGGFISDLFTKYNHSVVFLLGYQYFNQGSKAIVYLAQKDYFKTHLEMEPSRAAYLASIIAFPWSIKLLYGIISDKLPMFGSKRKSYVILMGLFQFLSLFAIYLWEIRDETLLTIMFFIANLSGAYLDVLVDALMVIQSRVDEDDGSEQLQSLSWGAMGAGGMTGSLVAGYLTENYHPKWSFLLYSFYGLIVVILGLNLDKKAEEDDEEEKSKDKSQNRTFKEEFMVSLNEIIEALKMPEIYLTLLFYVISSVTQPNFGTYSYYFQMEVIKFTKFQYAMFGVLGYASLSLGTAYFNMYLKEYEVRTLIKWAIFLDIFGCAMNYCFAMRWNLQVGISDIQYVIFTDIVISSLSMAFSQLPTMVLFAKITPKNIEATCFAFLTGTLNFSGGVMSPMLGTKLNDMFVGVTAENLKDYPTLILIQVVTSFLPFLYLHFIPLKSEIKEYQEKREKNEQKQ